MLLANLSEIEPPSNVRLGGRGLRKPNQKRLAMTANIAAKPTKRPGRQRRMSKLPLRGRLKAVAAGFWQLSNSPSTRKDKDFSFPMKTYLSFILIPFIGWGACALAADEQTAAVQQPPAGNARTFIPTDLEVPTFVPPAPPVEKKVPTMRVDSAVTVPTAHSRTLTILRGEASTLPDIPEPVVVAPRAPRQLTTEDLARQAEQRRCHLNFNAEVYENGVSILRWHHPDTEEAYEATCGFDVNLLAGIGQFTSDRKIYQLSFIPPGVRPTTRSRFSKLPLPKPPETAPDTIAITRGNANDPVGTATATLLRDLIATEKSRLIVYQEERIIYQQAAAAWEKSHPILPHDETIWFRPHRGSRYLTNPTPEKGITR